MWRNLLFWISRIFLKGYIITGGYYTSSGNEAYNKACMYSKLGDYDRAMAFLMKAISESQYYRYLAKRDKDLEELRTQRKTELENVLVSEWGWGQFDHLNKVRFFLWSVGLVVVGLLGVAYLLFGSVVLQIYQSILGVVIVFELMVYFIFDLGHLEGILDFFLVFLTPVLFVVEKSILATLSPGCSPLIHVNPLVFWLYVFYIVTAVVEETHSLLKTYSDSLFFIYNLEIWAVLFLEFILLGPLVVRIAFAKIWHNIPFLFHYFVHQALFSVISMVVIWAFWGGKEYVSLSFKKSMIAAFVITSLFTFITFSDEMTELWKKWYQINLIGKITLGNWIVADLLINASVVLLLIIVGMCEKWIKSVDKKAIHKAKKLVAVTFGWFMITNAYWALLLSGLLGKVGQLSLPTVRVGSYVSVLLPVLVEGLIEIYKIRKE